jgi:tryptophan synthase alpha chain
MIRSRYAATFARLERRGEGAFIPFLTLGDPDRATSAALIALAIEAGADALELGLPFSDPVADGPVIQAAATRALEQRMTVDDGFALVREARSRAPDLPIGILTYANLAWRRGVDRFMRDLASAGADSILLADVPLDESAPFRAAASAAGLAMVLIVPPNADDRRLAAIAAATEAYTYVTTRSGVTGLHGEPDPAVARTIERLKAAGSPPPVLGFGIATPSHAREGLAAGAAGVIAGSAVVRRIEQHRADPPKLFAELRDYLHSMKAATRRSLPETSSCRSN